MRGGRRRRVTIALSGNDFRAALLASEIRMGMRGGALHEQSHSQQKTQEQALSDHIRNIGHSAGRRMPPRRDNVMTAHPAKAVLPEKSNNFRN